MTMFNMERFRRKSGRANLYSTELEGINLHGLSTNNGQGYHVIKPLQRDESNDLPDFEVGSRMRNCCLAALCLTWATGVALLVTGVILLQKPQPAFMSRGVRVEIATLAINIFLTGLLEGNGFIHTAALRWALHLEGRLACNSNLRLFTSAVTSPPNSWYCNTLYAVTTITTYASASLFFQKAYNQPGATVVHPVALLLLGSGLLLLAILVTWSYIGENTILLLNCYYF